MLLAARAEQPAERRVPSVRAEQDEYVERARCGGDDAQLADELERAGDEAVLAADAVLEAPISAGDERGAAAARGRSRRLGAPHHAVRARQLEGGEPAGGPVQVDER